jgi:hypothetical protein
VGSASMIIEAKIKRLARAVTASFATRKPLISA